MTTFIVVPFKEFLQTLSKKRPDGLRTLLRVQILVYMVYWALAGYDSQLYLYMVKVIDRPLNLLSVDLFLNKKLHSYSRASSLPSLPR